MSKSLDQRGYNIVVVNEHAGKNLDRAAFDMYGIVSAAFDMKAYIDAVPTGCIVFAKIRDDGASLMNKNEYLALESIGSQYCRDMQYWDSHAVRVQGYAYWIGPGNAHVPKHRLCHRRGAQGRCPGRVCRH